jgi:hypothetical protein
LYGVWLRAGRPGDRGSIPGRGEIIFPLAFVFRPALGPTQPLVQWVPGLKRGRDVTLTTHPHLVPRSRISRSYTSSPPSAFVACSGTVLTQWLVEWNFNIETIQLTGNLRNHFLTILDRTILSFPTLKYPSDVILFQHAPRLGRKVSPVIKLLLSPGNRRWQIPILPLRLKLATRVWGLLEIVWQPEWEFFQLQLLLQQITI